MATNNLNSLKTEFPEQPTGRWKPKGNDKWFYGFMFAMLLLVNHFVGRLAGFGVIIAWILLVIPGSYGKAYSLVGLRLDNWRRARSDKDRQVEDTVLLWSNDQERFLKKPEPIDLAVHGIIIPGVDEGEPDFEIGLLFNNNRDTIVIEGEGSVIQSQDIEEQFDSNLKMADVIRKAAALTETRGHNAGWGWQYRTRPLDGPFLTASLGTYLDPMVLSAHESRGLEVSPRTKEQERWLRLRDNYDELMGVTHEVSKEVLMAAVCTVVRQDFDEMLSSGRPQGLPIVQLAQTLPAELEAAGVIEPHVLTPREIHRYFRTSWGVADLEDYYEFSLMGSDEDVLTSDQHQPQRRISAGWDFSVIDGTYNSVLWLSRFKTEYWPHELRNLTKVDVDWVTVSLVGGTQSSKGEYAWLDRVISVGEDFERAGTIVHKGPRQLKREEGLKARQQKVFESRYSQDYNIFVVVHHDNRRSLEEAVDQAMQHISLMGMEADRIEGYNWQLPFLLSATTSIDMNLL